MKKIILITDIFPYSPGEDFLETEINYYKDFNDINFMIMPCHSSDKIRLIDPPIHIDEFLIKNLKKKWINNIVYLFKVFSSKLFYKELIQNRLFNIKKLKILIVAMVKYKNYYTILDAYFKLKKDLSTTLVYTYWHNEITYALQSLKYKYSYKLITRIHGFDLYQERRSFNYMPLKKLFINNIDKVFTITQSANIYLINTYGFKPNILELSRLGVKDYNIISKHSENNRLHIVSCSYIIEVKRIDKIIDAICQISKQNLNIHYIWTHIGNGILYKTISKYAHKKLGNLENVNFYFTGRLDNSEVYKFYRNNKIDLFINVSKSEGVPVSIMEAMSCYIPIVAPDVGGISDMIKNKTNGYLLSSKCTINEIVDALNDNEFYKKKQNRHSSYKIFKTKFCAKNNYILFLNNLYKL